MTGTEIVTTQDADAREIPSLEDVLKYFVIGDIRPNWGVYVKHFCYKDVNDRRNWEEIVESKIVDGDLIPLSFVDIFELVMTHAEACPGV